MASLHSALLPVGQLASSTGAIAGQRLQCLPSLQLAPRPGVARRGRVEAATGAGTKITKVATKASKATQGAGTKIAKQLKVLAIGDKAAQIRNKLMADEPNVKLLAKVQELKLLSKAEKAGLLSLAENLGVSLSTIERLGLLSKAEKFGALSAAVNPKTPGLLRTVALVFLVAGPSLVYIIPEDNVGEALLQIVLAATCIAGGAAAFGGSKLVAALQRA